MKLLVFSICFLLTIAMPALWPKAQLQFFAPFLIMACYTTSRARCFWLALGCGTLLDLLSSYSHFGLYALNFCATMGLMYPLRRYFFADNLSTLPIMTFLFSILSTFLMALLLYSIEMQKVWSVQWMFTDLLVMPILDSCYAFTVFILPKLLLGKRSRRGEDYFLLK